MHCDRRCLGKYTVRSDHYVWLRWLHFVDGRSNAAIGFAFLIGHSDVDRISLPLTKQSATLSCDISATALYENFEFSFDLDVDFDFFVFANEAENIVRCWREGESSSLRTMATAIVVGWSCEEVNCRQRRLQSFIGAQKCKVIDEWHYDYDYNYDREWNSKRWLQLKCLPKCISFKKRSLDGLDRPRSVQCWRNREEAVSTEGATVKWKIEVRRHLPQKQRHPIPSLKRIHLVRTQIAHGNVILTQAKSNSMLFSLSDVGAA